MIFLGIDPGLVTTGWAVMETQGDAPARLVQAGTIKTDAKNTLDRRLVQIGTDISEILDQFHPDIVAVEKLYSHYKHPETAILMGHARGVIFEKSAAAGTQIVSYSANRIKKAVSGNGHASKAQIQRSIQALLNLPELPQPPDVADAIAVAVTASQQTSIPQELK